MYCPHGHLFLTNQKLGILSVGILLLLRHKHDMQGDTLNHNNNLIPQTSGVAIKEIRKSRPEFCDYSPGE